MLELVTLTALSDERGELLAEIERAILSGEEGSLLYLCATRPLLEETSRSLLARPGVRGLGRLRLVLFQGLVNLALREEMEALTPLDPALRDSLVAEVTARLAAEGRLKRLGPIAGTRGAGRTLAGLLAELKRAGVRPPAWRRAAAARGREIDLDVAELYEAYQAALERMQAVDPDDLGLWGLDVLARSGGAYFRGDPLRGRDPVLRLIVDGYQDFTPVQLAWLRVATVLVPRVTVYLEYDPDRPELYAATEGALRGLEALAGDGAAVRAAEEGAPVLPPALRHVAEELFRPPAQRRAWTAGEGPVAAVQVLMAQDDRSEARELARLIRQALRADPTLSPEDVAVVYRELGPEADQLAAELEAAGVPCSRVKTVPLAEVPAVRAAMEVLAAAADPDRFPNLLAAARCGYFALPGRESFESVALELGATLPTHQWLTRLEETLARLRGEKAAATSEGRAGDAPDGELEAWRISRDLQRYGAARRAAHHLLTRLGRWPRTLPIAAATSVTERTLQGLGIAPAALSILAPGELSLDEAAVLAARDLAALDRYLSAARSLQEVLAGAGRQEVESGLWLEALGQAARLIEVALPGLDPARGAGVRIIAAPAARRLRFRLVAVAGLMDGRFPKVFQPDWLLPDREREALRAFGVQLDTRRDLAAAERLHFYQSVACAGERLALSYPAAGPDGSQQLPSAFVQEVLDLFPEGAVPVTGPRPGQLWPDRWADVASPRELSQMAVAQALGEGGNQGGPGEGGSHGGLGEGGNHGGLGGGGDPDALAVLAVLQRGGRLPASLWPRLAAQAARDGALWTAHDGVLSSPQAKQALADRYHADYAFSASQLGAYGTCPFRFFAERLLRLAPLQEAGDEADPLDVGNLYHQILYAFWDGHRGEPVDPARRQAYRAELEDITAAQLRDYEANGLRSARGFWAVKRREMRARLLAFLDWELNLAAGLAASPAPAALELGFGMPGLDPASRREPVRLGGEAGLLLRGKIDRIDRTPDGGFLVLDYKTSVTPQVKDMEEGRDLQVPLYLLAARELLGEGAYPLGGGYESIRERRRNQGLWRGSMADRTGVLRGKGVLADEEWEERLAHSLDVAQSYVSAIRDGAFPVSPNGDCPEICPYRRICRVDRRRLERKGPSSISTRG